MSHPAPVTLPRFGGHVLTEDFQVHYLPNKLNNAAGVGVGNAFC
jgi:hypothetical protein